MRLHGDSPEAIRASELAKELVTTRALLLKAGKDDPTAMALFDDTSDRVGKDLIDWFVDDDPNTPGNLESRLYSFLAAFATVAAVFAYSYGVALEELGAADEGTGLERVFATVLSSDIWEGTGF